jgi:hypothetical protein
VAFAELGLILMNFRTDAHEACIDDLQLRDHFIARCDAIYGAGRSGTVDEILVSFPGHSKFKVHKVIPHAVKYGITAVFVTVSTNYCLYSAYMWKRFWPNNLVQDSVGRIRKTSPRFDANEFGRSLFRL